MKKNWLGDAMGASITATLGVVEVVFHGTVTIGGLAAYCRDVSFGSAPVYAGIGCFDKAEVAMHSVQVARLLVWMDPECFRTPIALVCRPEDKPFFDALALELARDGIVRVVFTDRAAARVWAREVAAVSRHRVLAQMQGTSRPAAKSPRLRSRPPLSHAA